MILNSIYEPVFELYNCNYGFRPKKSCQQAIQAIKINGTACDYAIEGDIQRKEKKRKGAFDKF
jgi:retron-type reverse transcriptase